MVAIRYPIETNVQSLTHYNNCFSAYVILFSMYSYKCYEFSRKWMFFFFSLPETRYWYRNRRIQNIRSWIISRCGEEENSNENGLCAVINGTGCDPFIGIGYRNDSEYRALLSGEVVRLSESSNNFSLNERQSPSN